MSNSLSCLHLIDLHRRVNQSCEPEAGTETYSACQHKEGIGGEEHVPEVQYARHHLSYLQLCEEVESCVQEEIQSRGS